MGEIILCIIAFIIYAVTIYYMSKTYILNTKDIKKEYKPYKKLKVSWYVVMLIIITFAVPIIALVCSIFFLINYLVILKSYDYYIKK